MGILTCETDIYLQWLDEEDNSFSISKGVEISRLQDALRYGCWRFCTDAETRHNLKFAAYTKQTLKMLSNTYLDEGTNIKHQSIKQSVMLSSNVLYRQQLGDQKEGTARSRH